MKKHITQEQLAKLTINNLTFYRNVFGHQMCVDIMEMIEFLNSRIVNLEMVRVDHQGTETWYIGEYNPFNDENIQKPRMICGELCDALWDKVKEIIEKMEEPLKVGERIDVGDFTILTWNKELTKNHVLEDGIDSRKL